MRRNSADHIRPDLHDVAFMEDGSLEVPGPSRMLDDVVGGAEVAFELRQRQVLGLRIKRPAKMSPAAVAKTAQAGDS